MNKLKAKLNEQGGFTLIEMLLVVAIICILVAVSIPVVNMNLERARQATDRANERAAQTLATMLYMGELDFYNDITHTEAWDGMDYLPGMAWIPSYNEFAQPTGIYYDAKNGTLSFAPPEGYGQSTGNKDCVIVISIDANGVFTPLWRVPVDGGI